MWDCEIFKIILHSGAGERTSWRWGMKQGKFFRNFLFLIPMETKLFISILSESSSISWNVLPKKCLPDFWSHMEGKSLRPPVFDDRSGRARVTCLGARGLTSALGDSMTSSCHQKFNVTRQNQFCGKLTSINCIISVIVKVSSSPDQFHCVQFPAWGIVVACNDCAAYTGSRDNSCAIFIFQCEELVNCNRSQGHNSGLAAIEPNSPLSGRCSLAPH